MSITDTKGKTLMNDFEVTLEGVRDSPDTWDDTPMTGRIIAVRHEIGFDPVVIFLDTDKEEHEINLGSYGALLQIRFLRQHESDGLVYTSNPPQRKCLNCGLFYWTSGNEGECVPTNSNLQNPPI